MHYKNYSLIFSLVIFAILAIFPGGFCYHLAFLVSIKNFYLWLDSIGAFAPSVFFLINAAVVIFLLPGLMMSIGAGLLFGFTQGVIIVVVSATIGALISFNIARLSFDKKTAKYFLEHPKMRALNEEFVGEGWRFILLTRLVPFFPFKLSNYFFGLAKFAQKDFFIGTFLGIIPITCINVYIGSVAADIGQLLEYRQDDFTHHWWLYLIGALITIFAICYIRAHLNQALLRYRKTNPKNILRTQTNSDEIPCSDD